MVWSQVSGVVQADVVRRERTALADVMRHQVEIHPEHKTSSSPSRNHAAFEELDIFSGINAHFKSFLLQHQQRRAEIESLRQIRKPHQNRLEPTSS